MEHPISQPQAGLPEWMRSIRDARNLNQKQLAERLGCAQSDVSRWEQGHRRIYADQLVAWMSALDLSDEERLEGLRLLAAAEAA